MMRNGNNISIKLVLILCLYYLALGNKAKTHERLKKAISRQTPLAGMLQG